MSSCKKESNSPANTNPDLSTVSTDSVKAITFYSASILSTVLKEGKSAVTGMGIAYGKNPNPTVVADKNVPYASFGVGTFITVLDDLESGTTYYVRAYATNSAGTSYGNEIAFNTKAQSLFNPNMTYGTVSDNNGNTYKTIQIGTQTWMAENLRTTKYRNGDPIPSLDDEYYWYQTSSGAFAENELYNWYAVVDSRNLCPVGWHVPSDAEWKTLEIFLGMSAADADLEGSRGTAQNIGGKLKSTSSSWFSPNIGATNESGFSGLPGKSRLLYGYRETLGYSGYWWSSTENSTTKAWGRDLNYSDGNSDRFASKKQSGLRVRCLRD